MRLKNYIILNMLCIGFIAYSQSGVQKKADRLFNKFAFYNAINVYKKQIEKNYNTDYATQKLADTYALMRNPDSAVVYYKKAVMQNHVPVVYYYNYAQALRGIENYEESQIWLQRFIDEGGKLPSGQFVNDTDFLNEIYNSKQHYFLTEVKLNSEYSDFGAYQFNNQIYFASARDKGVLKKHKYGWNNEPFLDIYVAENASDSLVTTKQKLKGNVNSVFHDGPVTITKDGKTMYFSRNDFIKSKRGRDKLGSTNLKIYKATFVDDKWTDIEELPFNSTDFSNGHPALNADETKLYFASDRPFGFGGSDIYYVDIKDDGSYGAPQNLGAIVNTNKDEKFPFVNNENALFFASNGHQGLGLLDIFGAVSSKNDEIVNVINLGKPINSSKDDFSFFMSEDGLTGFFASNRSGGKGSDDIYAYYKLPQLKIEGTITNNKTNEPLADAEVKLTNNKGETITSVKTEASGIYNMNIDRDGFFAVKAIKEGFVETTSLINTKGIDNSVTSIKEDIALSPEVIAQIQKEEFYPIYFDFNRSTIRKDGTNELDRIVNFMVNKYPEMTIKIEAYTDSRGPAEYNKKLSQDRANAAFNYLVNHGVNPNRIKEYKGFGEENLTNDCDGTKRCTEKQHQENRRTEFIVITMQ